MSVKTACGIVGKYFSSSRVFSLSWDIAMLKTYVMSSKRTKVKNTDRAATINPWLPGREMTWGCEEDGDKDDQDIIVATSTSISTLTTNTKRETKDTTTRTKNNPADQKLRQWNIILKNCVSPARNYNFVSSETINLGSAFFLCISPWFWALSSDCSSVPVFPVARFFAFFKINVFAMFSFRHRIFVFIHKEPRTIINIA